MTYFHDLKSMGLEPIDIDGYRIYLTKYRPMYINTIMYLGIYSRVCACVYVGLELQDFELNIVLSWCHPARILL